MIMFMYLALGVAGTGIVASEVFLGKLIDHESTHAPKNWVSDGKPYGAKTNNQNTSFWASGISHIVVAWDWLFVTPGWVQQSSRANTLLKMYRSWAGVSAVGVGGLLTIAFGAIWFGL